MIFGYNEDHSYLLPIIVFRCQNEHCRIGAVVGLESEPIETGSMGRVDHEVDDEEGVEGQGRRVGGELCRFAFIFNI